MAFKQIIYKVVEMKPALKISEVSSIMFPKEKFPEVTVNDRLIIVDWDNVFLIEFTGKFSKEGLQIFDGDILELKEDFQSIPKGFYIANWTPGGFMATNVHDPMGVPMIDEQTISRMEHRGNQFENGNILAEYLKQFKDVELKADEIKTDSNE